MSTSRVSKQKFMFISSNDNKTRQVLRENKTLKKTFATNFRQKKCTKNRIN